MDRKDVFVIDSGQIIEFDEKGARIAKDTVPGDYIYVDGHGVGDIGEAVLRDRRSLARDGFVVCTLAVDGATGELVSGPEIVTRGFVYVRDSGDLLDEMTQHVADYVRRSDAKPGDLAERVRSTLGSFIQDRFNRRPTVMPVVHVVDRAGAAR